ncbi:MAG TPA: sigma-70 family RNA polymerase sigma factor [Gemmataceae bacterium]
MDGRSLENVVRTLTARCGRAADAVPDADLLRRFADDGDPEAFAELHRRHGPLVWAACRSMLSTFADAEDAYQATFLALVQAAPKVRNPAAVGAWLHGVAVRVGLNLCRRAARRHAREQRAARPETERPVADGSWERLLAAVHEEVEKLPAGLRAAFVLCDLQGVPQPDAARRLGCPLGSLSGRLSQARSRLAARLQARGVAPAVAAGVLGVAATGSEAGLVPVALASAVRRFAVSPGAAPAGVQALVTEVTTMTHTKWAVAAVVVAGAATLGAGTVLIPTAGGQPPAATNNGSSLMPTTVAVVADAGSVLYGKLSHPPSRYRYVPLDAGQTAEPLAATVKRLEAQAAEGWEFCGTVDMQLTAAEVAALRGSQAATDLAAALAADLGRYTASADAAGEKRATHRVLVFKRQAAPAAGARGAATPAAERAAAPIAGDSVHRPVTSSTAPPAGGIRTAPGGLPPVTAAPAGGNSTAAGPSTPDTAPLSPGAAGPFGTDADPSRPAGNVGPTTVIYRAKVAAAETLEKVAASLMGSRRKGTVTAIADPRTGSLILTGEPNLIKEVVDRLEALEADLGGPKPQHGPGTRPATSVVPTPGGSD